MKIIVLLVTSLVGLGGVVAVTTTSSQNPTEATAADPVAEVQAPEGLNEKEQAEIQGVFDTYLDSDGFDTVLDEKLGVMVPKAVEAAAPSIIKPMLEEMVPPLVDQKLAEHKVAMSDAAAQKMVAHLKEEGIIREKPKTDTPDANKPANPPVVVQSATPPPVSGGTRLPAGPSGAVSGYPGASAHAPPARTRPQTYQPQPQRSSSRSRGGWYPGKRLGL